MAKITRKTQKVFAGSATNNGQFGSAVVGTKVTSTDPDVIQALGAWDTGWTDATISGQKLPTLEEMQGLQYVQTRQIAYTLQEGVPEYDAGTFYYTNSIVKEAGTFKLYGSLTNDNQGNPLSDATKWQLLIDLSTTVTWIGAQTALASASTTDLGSVASHNINITGTTTINSFGNSASISNPIYLIKFAGVLTINDSVNLTTIGGADIVTAAGDYAFVEFQGSSTWRVWAYFRADGTPIVNPSRVRSITKQVFASSGTYTPTAGMLYCEVEAIGGGGGGGGCAGTGSTAAAASGGACGRYAKVILSAADVGASKAVTIGALGAGGSAGNNNGAAGGTTSVGTLVVCPGGGGGFGAAAGAVSQGGFAAGAYSGSITPSVDLAGTGLVGVKIDASTTHDAFGGNGAGGFYGVGGAQGQYNAGGVNAGGYGAGGSGAGDNASSAGGNGSAGYVLITEYVG